MAHTIKISGVSDELLGRIDERWKGRHYADRSEYVRDLIRRDVLGESQAKPSFSQGLRGLFGALHDDAAHRGWTDQEIEGDIEEALSAVRAERAKRPGSTSP